MLKNFIWFLHYIILCCADDVVYNQSVNATSTLDKRRPDLRDELGYIAPPNRKLPPVPGSNYNTCDRIKRGRVWSKKKKTNTINCMFRYSLFKSSPLFFCFYFFFNPSPPTNFVEHVVAAAAFFFVFHFYVTLIIIIRPTLSLTFHMGSKAAHVRGIEQPTSGFKRHDAFA